MNITVLPYSLINILLFAPLFFYAIVKIRTCRALLFLHFLLPIPFQLLSPLCLFTKNKVRCYGLNILFL